ncbi:cytidine monophosphate-N-acetylneuraminic acid [Helicobacter cetorum MIT 99-5656]|uniref:Cytidine monophosphate-N-acetylneuraminic acid n=1 Tax=Helicobacter cetorum (strain ATCC BAA-540 / CCUG 52418 / MIT 99-5656) TaxID=1163745 RepID=I0ESB6_HELCM|nr:cytidine monophosphate-N-acetylneuraminic acid [Helicobacter cetorum MIT 99-5656]
MALSDKSKILFYAKYKNSQIEWLIDSVCEHMGGCLCSKEVEFKETSLLQATILKDPILTCPSHSWKLDIRTLTYQNGIKKAPLSNYTIKNNILSVSKISHLKNPFKGTEKGEFSCEYLNHASLFFECNGVKIITDPWLIGPCFLGGWWHKEPSTKEAIKHLKSADFIYISHNHPDHLNAQTLALVPKDKPFIIPNFESKSVENSLRGLGFNNIHALDFKKIISLDSKIQVSILKSGDFRDDSGLYLCLDNHEVLLSVDSNFLNHYVLPKDITMLATSFASGSSGFPLCFDNYSLEEKQKISAQTRMQLKNHVAKMMQVTMPKFYMPYAGMFSEEAKRDSFIKEYNVKNAPKDYESLCEKNNIAYIEPNNATKLSFKGKDLIKTLLKTSFIKDFEPEFYIDLYKKYYQYDSHALIEYLKNAQYFDKQIVTFIPTNDDFSVVVGACVEANFDTQNFRVLEPNEIPLKEKENFRVMQLKVRAEILACVIKHALPFEDFSIGFHCRILRSPNTYESAFWFHFTNIYINPSAVYFKEVEKNCAL